MKKVLFIDRDGTLIIEPPTDYQVDSLEKLEFYPGVFQNLAKIVHELDYELVMITNQDGLGTDSFPEDTFWPAHNKMLNAFENEGISFHEILIDRSFPEENAPTRKPGTGLVTHYIKGNYNLDQSYVIGDRLSDVQLAKNMGCGSIYLGDEPSDEPDVSTKSWAAIYELLSTQPRIGSVKRKTKETNIEIQLNLDGAGESNISTGIGFFDHMLEQIARHAMVNLTIKATGDLHLPPDFEGVDEHHIIEDVGIALGDVFLQALGSKKGIERYGYMLPMDDCLAQVAIDFGGRPWLVWDADFSREKIGAMPTEMFSHFFKSFSDHSKSNLNIKAEGENEHHKIEAIFKAFARAVKMAVSKTGHFSIPSTKGSL